MCGTRLCDDRLLSVHRQRIRENVDHIHSVQSFQYDDKGRRKTAEPSWHEVTEGIQCHQPQGKEFRLTKTTIPEAGEVDARLWRRVYTLDLSLASCCNSLTRISELIMRQFIDALLTWLSLRDTSLWRAINNEECDVVWRNLYFLFSCTPRFITSETMVCNDRSK